MMAMMALVEKQSKSKIYYHYYFLCLLYCRNYCVRVEVYPLLIVGKISLKKKGVRSNTWKNVREAFYSMQQRLSLSMCTPYNFDGQMFGKKIREH